MTTLEKAKICRYELLGMYFIVCRWRFVRWLHRRILLDLLLSEMRAKDIGYVAMDKKCMRPNFSVELPTNTVFNFQCHYEDYW